MEKDENAGFIFEPSTNVSETQDAVDQDAETEAVVEEETAVLTANNITAANVDEETELVATLTYTESTNALATACTLSSLTNITETTPCSCDGSGVCTVGVTGNNSYFGAASFNYTITAGGQTSAAALTAFTIDDTAISCPSGYIGIIGNGSLGTNNDFCVMKYEAREIVAGTPVSQSAGVPKTSITSITAQANCEAIVDGSFSGTFSLISNPEWMTIARDIEAQDSNWSGGTVGAGMLNKGFHRQAAAGFNVPSTISNASDPYTDTGNNAGQSAGSGWESKRTHTLSNLMEIWDFSGNASEAVDWLPTSGHDRGPSNVSFGYTEFSSPSGFLQTDDYQPSGSYTSTESMGMFSGGSGRYAERGGSRSLDVETGIYHLSLSSTGGTTSFKGYRCVYRP